MWFEALTVQFYQRMFLNKNQAINLAKYEVTELTKFVF